MNFIVHNYGLHVGQIRVSGVTASSVFHIGDSKTVRLQSFFDTPPESLIIGPFASEQSLEEKEVTVNETNGVRE
ncbi:spore gernimation protein GerPD [Halobacillus locisalis]|uniref:Spore gernimation protein GerPD n=1 Tax=Halobacillus locisalis TaxID=220753 RepID=A0A838CRT1_9BACI|nr:spore gernimation protein GerPD [Halobacillus locisalis]MBA2174529.1 spore gernimation protein GerPD [Halobacillus locisalis]